jgi:uncharacterized protein
MNIKPDKKLLTKSWLLLITISVFIVLFAAVLHLIPYLDNDVDINEFAKIVWIIVFAFIALMWIISVPIIKLWIKNLSYTIGEDKVTIHKGILTKMQQNIPYRMVTDFMLERSLFDRWLGIGSIKVQTAGQTQNTTGYEGKLAGIVNWDELHEQLRSNLGRLYPKAEKISGQPEDVQNQILQELKHIRKVLEEQK